MDPTPDLADAPTLPAAGRSGDPGEPPATAFGGSEPPRLGRYVVLGTLGHGGMGTVLEAFDRTLDRRVALKVLHRGLDEQSRQRLLREAQAMAKLSHPNVVQVYEAGEVDGQGFVAMELVRGQTLHAWIRRDPRPDWRRCVEVFSQAGAGLAAAHARGLVHRDFKPGNAILDEDGRARVLDFGLARRVDARDDERAGTAPGTAAEGSALDVELTRTGTVLGTPAYMPLEQLEGHEADARSDQFSFCVSLYEALYGERPFEGNTLMALVVSMTTGEPRPAPKGTAVPPELRRVLLRGLAPAPDQRWPSMDGLLTELRRITAPRRRGWWALGLAGGLGILGVGLSQYAEVGFRCEGAEAQLEGIWDDARKQEVEAAILGTSLAYAPDTWARIEPRLDEYAQTWIAKHTEVCEATRVTEVQTEAVMNLRMGCLSRRRIDLRATVGVLALADEKRVRKAVDLVAALPALSRCDDVEALSAELPPPEDPQVAARVEQQREELTEAQVLDRAGDFAAGGARAQAVVEAAEAIGYPPLLAEALLMRGMASDSTGEYPKAAAELERAFLLAMQHEHDDVELQAARMLTSVVGMALAQHEEGLRWGAIAQALAGRPDVREDVEAAVLKTIGLVLQGTGKLQQALDHLQRALAIEEEVLGPQHPRVATALGAIGVVLLMQGRVDEALGVQQRALSIQEQALGPRHPAVSTAMINIGNLLSVTGRPDEALEHYRRALAIAEAAYAPGHPTIGTIHGAIGLLQLGQGHLDDALASLQRALAITEPALGPHPDVAFTLGNIGEVLQQQGKPDQAREHYERALAMTEQVLGPRHRDVAGALVGLAELALARGDVATARSHAERVVAVFESAEVAPVELAEVRFLLARTLESDAAQRSRARTLVEQARASFVEGGEVFAPNVARCDAWLIEHPAP